MRPVIVGIDIDERCNDDDDDDDDAPVKLRIQSLLHGRLHYKSGTNIWRCSNSNLPCICFPFEQPWHCLHIWWKIIFSLKQTEMTEMTKTSCVLCSDRSFLFFIRQKYRSAEDFFQFSRQIPNAVPLNIDWLKQFISYILDQTHVLNRIFLKLELLWCFRSYIICPCSKVLNQNWALIIHYTLFSVVFSASSPHIRFAGEEQWGQRPQWGNICLCGNTFHKHCGNIHLNYHRIIAKTFAVFTGTPSLFSYQEPSQCQSVCWSGF